MGDISDQLEEAYGHTLGTEGFQDHQKARGVKYIALHFLGKHGEELLHIQDQSVDKDPLVFALMGSYPGDTDLHWYGHNEFYQRDYTIASVERVYEMVQTRRGTRKEIERVKITFANGEQRTFAATGGVPRGYCRSLEDRKKLTEVMNYDRAVGIYRLHYDEKAATNQTGVPQGFEPCVCQRPGYYSGLPGGACENCMNEGIVPVYTSNTRNIEMNTQEMLTILQRESGAKVVRAAYLDNNGAKSAPNGLNMPKAGYCFKNVVGVQLKEGDLIVVETRDTYAIVQVTDPDVMATEVGCALHELKHVVFKVRNDEFIRVKEAENNAIRKLALSEVTSKLDTYRKQVGDGAFEAVAGLLGVDLSRNALSDAGNEVIDAGGGGSSA
jgi:hypothetical protein